MSKQKTFILAQAKSSSSILAISLISTLTILLTTTIGLPIQNKLNSNTAHAASSIPPESCFAYQTDTPNTSEVTITFYYEHENNDSNNPACTKEPIIPDTLGGQDVRVIGDYAFSDNQLTSVTIPNSVTSIGNSAFSNNHLTSVIIPNSVTSIGNSAFRGNQLTSVTIPNSVTSIGDYAFSDNQLTSVIIPNSVTSIGGWAFNYNQLTSVTLGNSVTSIGDRAFYDNQLTSITIPDSVTTIGNDAFRHSPLHSVTYNGNTYTNNDPIIDECYIFDPDTGTLEGLYSVDLTVMQNHSNACIGTELNIPSSIGGVTVEEVGHGAFTQYQITSATIPNSITSIGSSAFRLNQLTTLFIPESVTFIDAVAFMSNNLASVTFEGSSASVDPMAFVVQAISGGTSSMEFLYALDNPQLDPIDLSAIAQSFYDSVIYTQIYADDPDSLGLTDMFFTEADMLGEDLNNNGHQDDVVSGQIINPAFITITHEDEQGSQISSPSTITGDGLSSYLAIDNEDNDLGLYYRTGGTPTIEPLSIDGYDLPPSITTDGLEAGGNSITFIYTSTGDDGNGDSNGNGDDQGDNNTGGSNSNGSNQSGTGSSDDGITSANDDQKANLAKTGTSLSMYVALALLILALSSMSLIAKRKLRY